jgi:DDE superfamily endonuclease
LWVQRDGRTVAVDVTADGQGSVSHAGSALTSPTFEQLQRLHEQLRQRVEMTGAEPRDRPVVRMLAGAQHPVRDELRARGLTPPVVLGDGAYGDITELRTGLSKRAIFYVLDVKAVTSANAESVAPQRPESKPGRGRPPSPRYRADPSSLRQLALDAGAQAAVEIQWREGTRGTTTSRWSPSPTASSRPRGFGGRKTGRPPDLTV